MLENEDEISDSIESSQSANKTIDKIFSGSAKDGLTPFGQSQRSQISSKKLTIESNEAEEMSASGDMTESSNEDDLMEREVEVPMPQNAI